MIYCNKEYNNNKTRGMKENCSFEATKIIKSNKEKAEDVWNTLSCQCP